MKCGKEGLEKEAGEVNEGQEGRGKGIVLELEGKGGVEGERWLKEKEGSIRGIKEEKEPGINHPAL